jgi:hypothetical protein
METVNVGLTNLDIIIIVSITLASMIIAFIIIKLNKRFQSTAAETNSNYIVSPLLDGTILRYKVNEGDEVQKGTTILVVKSMNMEFDIKSAVSGKVHFLVPPGTNVISGQLITEIGDAATFVTAPAGGIILPADFVPAPKLPADFAPVPAQSSDPPLSMDTGFVSIVRKINSERGFSILENFAKCKSLLQDYTAGEYKKESRLLLLAIEAGCPSEIAHSTEPEITQKKLVNKLHDEFSVDKTASGQIITLLYGVYNEKGMD